MDLERLRTRFEIKQLGEAGSFAGYASVFEVVDSDRDVVAPGAFAASLAARGAGGVKMLWQHDARTPIGVWREIAEDARGLFVRGELVMGVQAGAEAHALMKAGALDGLSIGFRTIGAEVDEETGVRRLTEVDLWEISPVTFPANDEARIGAVKAADIRSKRDLERALREAGFSRKDAAWIASNWRPPAQRDAGTSGIDELAGALCRAATTLTTMTRNLSDERRFETQGARRGR